MSKRFEVQLIDNMIEIIKQVKMRKIRPEDAIKSLEDAKKGFL